MNELKNIVLPYLKSGGELLNLYSDLLAVILAATALGWIVGTMSQKSRAKRLHRATVASWEKRYTSLEDTARADAENLEERLQHIATESKSFQESNKVLTESLRKTDSSVQKARAESIEMNRQHAETQERLQRIIQQKDHEIVQLAERYSALSEKPSNSTATGPTLAATAGSRISDVKESEVNYADTVAINTSNFSEVFDATVQLPSTEKLPVQAAIFEPTVTQLPDDNRTLDDSLDDTAQMDTSQMEDSEALEESTLALDDEALAFAQRSYPTRRRD